MELWSTQAHHRMQASSAANHLVHTIPTYYAGSKVSLCMSRRVGCRADLPTCHPPPPHGMAREAEEEEEEDIFLN